MDRLLHLLLGGLDRDLGHAFLRDPELLGGALRKVDVPPTGVRTAIVDLDLDLPARGGVGHGHLGAERQLRVGRGHGVLIERLTAGGGPAMELPAIVGGLALLLEHHGIIETVAPRLQTFVGLNINPNAGGSKEAGAALHFHVGIARNVQLQSGQRTAAKPPVDFPRGTTHHLHQRQYPLVSGRLDEVGVSVSEPIFSGVDSQYYPPALQPTPGLPGVNDAYAPPLDVPLDSSRRLFRCGR